MQMEHYDPVTHRLRLDRTITIRKFAYAVRDVYQDMVGQDMFVHGVPDLHRHTPSTDMDYGIGPHIDDLHLWVAGRKASKKYKTLLGLTIDDKVFEQLRKRLEDGFDV